MDGKNEVVERPTVYFNVEIIGAC
jgi:hypothetical protein